MFGLQKIEIVNLNSWHTGYFDETETCTTEGNNKLSRVANGNYWIRAKKEEDGSFICDILSFT